MSYVYADCNIFAEQIEVRKCFLSFSEESFVF